MKNLIYLTLLSLLLVSCGNSHPDSITSSVQLFSSNIPDDFIVRSTPSKQVWDSNFSSSILEFMKDPSLVPIFETPINDLDLSSLHCTNFNKLNINEKALFYIVFMASITSLESDFDPSNKTYDRYHNNCNIGLLQIDIDSAIRHAPDITSNDISNNELEDPLFNIHVGLYILKNQIIGKWKSQNKGRLFPEKSYYWETLNNRNRSKFINAFNINYNLLPFCEN